MRRSYTRKVPRTKHEESGDLGGGSSTSSARGGNSTRGKRRRVAAIDLDAKTIVASNPFDDDQHNRGSNLHHNHYINQQPVHLQNQAHPIAAPIGPPYMVGPGPPPLPMHLHTNIQEYPPPPPPPPPHHLHHHHHQPPLQPAPPIHHHMGPLMRPPPPLMIDHSLNPQQQVITQTPPPQVAVPPQIPPAPRTNNIYVFQSYTPLSSSSSPTPSAAAQQPTGPVMHQMETPGHQSPMYHQPTPPQQASNSHQHQTIQAQQQSPHQGLLCCLECRQPIYSNEAKIMCRAGCEAYYHRRCSGLTELACELLLREAAAEWACGRCICDGDRRIPVVRPIHNQPPTIDCRQTVWL